MKKYILVDVNNNEMVVDFVYTDPIRRNLDVITTKRKDRAIKFHSLEDVTATRDRIMNIKETKIVEFTE